MNETETKAELIDPALAVAGWGGGEGSRILREYFINQPPRRTPARLCGIRVRNDEDEGL